MYYSISEVAEKMNLTASSIRFYDKHGLLPFVERDKNGRRKFKDNDLNFIRVINCLKKSAVPVDTIGEFIQLTMQGDETLLARYQYLDYQEKQLADKINELEEQLAFLRFKKWYYKTSVEAGTEAIHFVEGSNFVKPDTEKEYLNELKKTKNPEKLINLNND